jgi:MFS superfamily sulfate permease-like transporter
VGGGGQGGSLPVPAVSVSVDFSAVWLCAGDFLAMAVLLVLKISLTVPAYEKALKTRFDKSKELTKYGIATMLSSLLGGAGTCPGITNLSVIVQMKGSERVPTIIAPIIFALWYFTRFSFVPLAPKFIFAGMLISSGYHLCVTWLLLPFFRIPFTEWLIVVSIVVFFIYLGMLNALAIGAVLSVVLFAYKFHEVGCIQFVSDLSMFRSTKERSHQHSYYLDTHCESIKIIQLQGFLSFANIGQLFDLISKCILKSTVVEALSKSVAAALVDDRLPGRVNRSNTLLDLYGYVHTGDNSINPQSFNDVHSALLDRHNSLSYLSRLDLGDIEMNNQDSKEKMTIDGIDYEYEDDLYDENEENFTAEDIIANGFQNRIIKGKKSLEEKQKPYAIIIHCNLLLGLVMHLLLI